MEGRDGRNLRRPHDRAQIQGRLVDGHIIAKRRRHRLQIVGVADPRILVATDRYVEPALRIQPKKSVEPGAVQVNHHRRKGRGVTRLVRALVVLTGVTCRVESLVSHVVEVLVRVLLVAGGQRGEGVDHTSRVIADRAVAADQIGIGIQQDDATIVKKTLVIQVKKNRTAAHKRLEVCAKYGRIEAADVWQELSLSTGPF